jgi:hypothetical protein
MDHQFHLHTKSLLHRILIEKVDEKIAAAHADLVSATESRNSDTKSSAGDKHETGRAMMQMEVDYAGMQLQKALQLKGELDQIDFQTKSERAVAGSLVTTSRGQFLLSIGLGRLETVEGPFFAISPGSPIGQALTGKKKGDTFAFQGSGAEVLMVA